MKESQIFPAVALGFRDIGGTNLFGAEYLTFSKYINNFDFTFGLGWGNLNGNAIKNPLSYLADRFETRGNQSLEVGSSQQTHIYLEKQAISVA